MFLAVMRHREVGSSVVAVLDDNHSLPASGRSGDLHGVLHGLSPGVEQR